MCYYMYWMPITGIFCESLQYIVCIIGRLSYYLDWQLGRLGSCWGGCDLDVNRYLPADSLGTPSTPSNMNSFSNILFYSQYTEHLV